MDLNNVTIGKLCIDQLCVTITKISHSYCAILMMSIFDLHCVTSIESSIDLNCVIANKTKFDSHSPTPNVLSLYCITIINTSKLIFGELYCFIVFSLE